MYFQGGVLEDVTSCPDHGTVFWVGRTARAKALRTTVMGTSEEQDCSCRADIDTESEAVKSVATKESVQPRSLTSGLTFT